MIKKLFILCIFFGLHAQNRINFQTFVKDFVLSTKQISIPEFPDAFNPSVVRWQEKLLLSFRTRNGTNKETYVGFVWLDDNFDPISKPSILQIPDQKTVCQDPRLVVINDTLYAVYNDTALLKKHQRRRMFFAKVIFENETFVLDNKRLLCGPWDNKTISPSTKSRLTIRQKNWVPFVYNNNVLFSYKLQPHLVVPLQDDGNFEVAFASKSLGRWPLGELRGGTQAIRLKNNYLGFFHSCKILASDNSKRKKMRHYFMGAYLFSDQPPFKITHISPQPIVGDGFYNGKMNYNNRTPLRVIFPTGCIASKKYIYVTYGRQDFESWVIKLDKKKLLKSLVPCL